jgi:uncharacterized protein DUF5605
VRYDEGAVVGYRFYDANQQSPLFPFGHGLSYGRYAYDNLRVSTDRAAGRVLVTVDVTNVGQSTNGAGGGGKPVVVDECTYEGDLDQGWGNITGEELVRRFWEGAVRGGYVGHGETYYSPDEVIFWAKGGALKGTSPPRIAFLRASLEDGPDDGLEPLPSNWDLPWAGIPDRYYLAYFGSSRPRFRTFTAAGDVVRGRRHRHLEHDRRDTGRNVRGEVPGRPPRPRVHRRSAAGGVSVQIRWASR